MIKTGLLLLALLTNFTYAAHYRIIVYTGSVDSAGTNANVYVVFYGTKGISQEFQLGSRRNAFEKGQPDTFSIETGDIGEVTGIRIRHDRAGDKDGWFLEKVVIRVNGTEMLFPCYKWLAVDEDDGAVERYLPRA